MFTLKAVLISAVISVFLFPWVWFLTRVVHHFRIAYAQHKAMYMETPPPSSGSGPDPRTDDDLPF